MGGGAGASIHGRLRVATENSVFAMSETALGLFLDVGASCYFLKLFGSFGSMQRRVSIVFSAIVPVSVICYWFHVLLLFRQVFREGHRKEHSNKKLDAAVKIR